MGALRRENMGDRDASKTCERGRGSSGNRVFTIQNFGRKGDHSSKST